MLSYESDSASRKFEGSFEIHLGKLEISLRRGPLMGSFAAYTHESEIHVDELRNLNG